MKRLLILGLLAMICLSCTVSKRTSFLQYPEDYPNATESYDIDAYEAKYGKYDGVYIMHEDILEHSGTKENSIPGAEWSFHHIHREKYMILNPESDLLSTYKIWIEPEDMYIRTISPDGEVKYYTKYNMQETKDEYGGSDYSIAFPDVKKGTIVDIGYDIAYPGQFAVDEEVMLQFSIPCEKLSYSYAYPSWWKVIVKKIGPGQIINYTEDIDPKTKKKTIKYVATDIPPLTWEPFAPFYKEVAQYIRLMVTDLSMAGWNMNRPDGWKESTKGLSKDYVKNSHKYKDLVKSTADYIIEGIEKPEDKLQALVSFVQNDIDQSSDGEDGNLKKILTKKKGDIFDKTCLILGLCEAAELPATMLLAHSAIDGYFDVDYVSFRQLYTPAVRVSIDKTDYVIFPYMENLPINHTPEWFQGQKALIINEMPNTVFWDIPEGNLANNKVVENYTLKINPDGLIEVTEEKTYNGYRAYFTREEMKDLKENEIKEMMEGLLTYRDGDVDLLDYEIVDKDEYTKPLIIKMKYNIENLVTVTPDEVLFQTGGLLSPTSIKKYAFDAEERLNPVKIYYSEEIAKEIVINFPDEWKVASELSDVLFENLFGVIEGHYYISDNTINVDQKVFLNKTHESKEKVTDLMDLIGRTSKLDVPTIIFDNTGIKKADS